MPISTSSLYITRSNMCDNVNSHGEMRSDIRFRNVPYREPPDSLSKELNGSLSHFTELGLTSSPLGYKTSMSTDGDWSDGRPRRGSETGTDVTVPDADYCQPKDGGKANIDGKNEKKKMKRFRFAALLWPHILLLYPLTKV